MSYHSFQNKFFSVRVALNWEFVGMATCANLLSAIFWQPFTVCGFMILFGILLLIDYCATSHTHS